jgi:hypothetical protein
MKLEISSGKLRNYYRCYLVNTGGLSENKKYNLGKSGAVMKLKVQSGKFRSR